MNEHENESSRNVVVVNKGGVGKSLLAEFLVEVVAEGGVAPDFVEMESVSARMRYLEDNGRVQSHRFVRMGESDAKAVVSNPLASTEYWDQPAAFMAETENPVVVDVGAQGFDILDMWLKLKGRRSPWSQPDGQHGRGLTFWVPTNHTKDGEASALAAAERLRVYLPGARIIVVCNNGAPREFGERIAKMVANIEIVVVPAVPGAIQPVFASAHTRFGLFETARLYDSDDRLLAEAERQGVTDTRMQLASETIAEWAKGVCDTLRPFVLPAGRARAQAPEMGPTREAEPALVAE
jgi:hypothetical protein